MDSMFCIPKRVFFKNISITKDLSVLLCVVIHRLAISTNKINNCLTLRHHGQSKFRTSVFDFVALNSLASLFRSFNDVVYFYVKSEG